MTTPCPICDAVALGHRHPSFIAELPHSLVVLSDNQGPRGWSTLLLKHHAEHLDDLPRHTQLELFDEVARVAHAIRLVFPTSGKDARPPRINYECLGNLVHHVHWHVIPRHADDPTPTKAVWGWDQAALRGALAPAQRVDLLQRLRHALLP